RTVDDADPSRWRDVKAARSAAGAMLGGKGGVEHSVDVAAGYADIGQFAIGQRVQLIEHPLAPADRGDRLPDALTEAARGALGADGLLGGGTGADVVREDVVREDGCGLVLGKRCDHGFDPQSVVSLPGPAPASDRRGRPRNLTNCKMVA